MSLFDRGDRLYTQDHTVIPQIKTGSQLKAEPLIVAGGRGQHGQISVDNLLSAFHILLSKNKIQVDRNVHFCQFNSTDSSIYYCFFTTFSFFWIMVVLLSYQYFSQCGCMCNSAKCSVQ